MNDESKETTLSEQPLASETEVRAELLELERRKAAALEAIAERLDDIRQWGIPCR